MIFRPHHTGIALWPAECLIEGSITSVANGHQVEVIEHYEEDDGKRIVLLQNTKTGTRMTISGDVKLPLIKAPPTWHP